MARLLFIGNKNISSWSMRAWIALREKGVAFEERVIDFNDPGRLPLELARLSPAARVPVLNDDGVIVFDSLAIMEYIEETFPGPALLPGGRASRARARSLLAWMHAGLADLRRGIPFEMTFGERALEVSEGARRDAGTLLSALEQELEQSGGPYLFGAVSFADLTFAPVLRRLAAGKITLEGRPRIVRWAAELMGRDSVREWIDAAEALPPYAGEARFYV
jgi:glutathione S-transferase